MQEWIGYLLATVVAGVVLLIVQSASFRGQEAAVAGIQYRAAKENAIDMASMMSRDFRNIGANYPDYPLDPQMSIVQYDTVAWPHVFRFVAQIEKGQPPDTVEYRWSPADSVDLGGTTVAGFSLERWVGGGGSAYLSGANSNSITHLTISLEKSDGGAIVDPWDTRQIAVDMRSVSTLGASSLVNETRWNEVIHPMHLARLDGIPEPN
jgi:hypothetical protein